MPASVAPLHPPSPIASSSLSTPLSLPSPPSAGTPHPHAMPTPAAHAVHAPRAGLPQGALLAPRPAQAHPAPTQSSAPFFSFTQGVLLGQASMIILAALFLKYVVFEDPDAAKRAREERKRLRAAARGEGGGEEDEAGGKGKRGQKNGKVGKGGGKAKASSRTPPDFPAATLSAAALLGALSYDLSTHPPESLDWLNVLSAQLISSYRALAASHASGGARALIEEALNRRTGGTEEGAEAAQGMVGLDFVEVDEVELGEGFPALSDARRVELDLDYIDTVVLSVSTRVVLNFPRPRFAVLPISLSLTLERFSGTLTVELPPPAPAPAPAPSSSSTEPHHHHHPGHPSVHLSLHPDFELQLATSSLLGSRAKLQDVPKIEQLLVARIRAAIQDRVVWPGRVEVSLPSLSRDKSRHHHHHHHSHSHSEAHVHDAAAVPPLADDLAASPLRTTPLSPLASPLDPSPSTPPSSSSTSPSPHFDRPLRNPLLSRTATSSTTASASGADTPSVDLSGPDGPSIALHPRVRPPPAHLAHESAREAAAAAAMPSPNPSESLPGYFPPMSGRSGLSGAASKGFGAAGAQGMRYRAAAGGAGVGIGLGR
ncbi:uncharacterized protein RHOBADRAFT_50513 [Rhodotorula graminis WP1]|uniref:Maintenance of mitochondrial morphology protein 1 n=1 Tax=Rhodotorula graminis (strain WP1) TaxID=578459 RepID=A0A194SBM7_RHOGW|nr:uncharacterized protein RHOBADRAFT_50513 [Rhodotorula graminis WP1]KPV77989.1 hypothetical protein RHOBADRAFT_50513 [Rhodotorula graminis WP1]